MSFIKAATLTAAASVLSVAIVSPPASAGPSSSGLEVGYSFNAKRGHADVFFRYNREPKDQGQPRTRWMRGKVFTSGSGFRNKRISQGPAYIRLDDWYQFGGPPWGPYQSAGVAHLRFRFRYCGKPKVTTTFYDRDHDRRWQTFEHFGCP